MKSLDLSDRMVPGGFFINAPRSQPYLSPATEGGRYEIIGTYADSGAPVRECLIAMIRQAKEQVFVASFVLGDDEIIAELISAAARLRGGVYVITALDEKSLRQGLLEQEDEDFNPAVIEERGKNFERLTSGGVYVRGHEDCHAKFAVVDRTTALVGSANFVTNSFEYAGELNVVVRDPVEVLQVRRFFTERWYEGCRWEIPPSGTAYTVSARQPKPAPVHPEIGERSGSQFVWTNGDSQTLLLDVMRNVIDGARRELLLSTYSCVGMAQRPEILMEHVSRAIGRGVAAKLFIRQRNASPRQMDDVVAFHKMGVKIHGDTRNHAKIVAADGKLAVVHSANLDSQHGLTSGVEAGVRLDEPSVVSHVVRYIEHAIANANARFVMNPPHAQLDGSLAAKWCKKWPGQRELVVSCEEEQFGTFAKEAESGPVLFERSGEGLSIFGGNAEVRIEQWDNESEVRGGNVAVVMIKRSASNRLTEWLQSVRGGKDTHGGRGFCPARISWKRPQ